MTALTDLRSACTQGKSITLLNDQQQPTSSIKEAKSVRFGENEADLVYPIDTVTEFYNEDVAQPLKNVVFCWLHDKSSIVDYKNECLENGVQDFKFLVKTELSSWLNGTSDICKLVRADEGSHASTAAVTGTATTTTTGAAATAAGTGAASTATADAAAGEKRKYEVESVDHNAALRGSKNIDFGYLISDAKRLITQLKKSKTGSLANGSSSSYTASGSSRGHSSGSSASNLSFGSGKKQPIIIISPATTSLLTLTNIKEFLENGVFVDPNSISTRKPSSGIVTVSHKSEKLSSVASQIIVVDNVDIFTKPEYWDRVVGIFTTGQAWQFSKYKYSKPEDLFQKYPGFYLSYSGDVTPKQIKDWNVTEIKVDRGDKRFRDKMIVRDFWLLLEKSLISKGYGK